MPRRPVDDDNDSQKENSGVSSRVKTEKVKTERVKQEKTRESKKARVETEDEEDAEGEDDAQDGEEDDEEGGGSPKGRKRARVNDDGDSRPSNGEGSGAARTRTKTLPRDEDGFIPGSIVRIQLRNFVTYDWVEFRPGPYLNMILGPNGTGKSSIACAICLGLNWSPKILGRATNISSFVKNDTNDGHIEMELKGPKGKPNLIIRRNLDSKTNSSSFTLNGQHASGGEISQRMAELNVQVGNLCSFLPQDKVSEFAQMTPQELLKETQRAAGDENLTTWHEILITSGKELKGLREACLRMDGENAQLTQMKDRNENLERDVERYKARRKLEFEIALLEILLPVQEYRESLKLYKATKILQRDLHARVKALRDKNKPAHGFLKRLDQNHKRLNDLRDDKKKAAQTKFKEMGKKWKLGEQLEDEVEQLSIKLQDIKKVDRDRAKRIKELERNISKMEDQIANPPKVEALDPILASIKKINIERRETDELLHDVQRRQAENINDSSRQNAVIHDAEAQLRQLDNVSEQKLRRLRSWDADCADTVVWLRNNKDKFQMEVFEPPYMCLSVPNSQFTNAVEACMGPNNLKCFVAQCQEDYNTLNRAINDGGVLGRKARVNTFYRAYNAKLDTAPPMSREELTKLGFQGYALDYVDCPEGLKWYLKLDCQMHRTAIGLDPRRVNVPAAMNAVSQAGGANFVAGTTLNMVSRSRYGTRAAQNMTRDIHPARNLVNASVDPQEQARQRSRIDEANQALAMLKEVEEKLTEEEQRVRQQWNEQVKRGNELAKRKKAIQDAEQYMIGLESKLRTQKDKLTAALNAPSMEVQKAQLDKKILDCTNKRVRIAKEYLVGIRSAIADLSAASRVTLECLQVEANKAALQKLCDEKDVLYQKALADFEEVDTRFKAIKDDSKAKLIRSRAIMDDADPEVRAEYEAIEQARLAWDRDEANANRTPPPEIDERLPEELQVALDAKKEELQVNNHTNAGVVEQYERRKKEIEDLEAKLEERRTKAEKIERDIKNARDNWEPALQNLVGSIGQKFSAAFDRIGCAGEIRIDQNEDYDKWAIDILVKFRDNEKLQLLTGQRQSGGERSLTTILYLMSLTEEARAPFSLVDEINQGMDQRAERAVHDSMVEVTCKENSAQYFLITPKLLPDLSYHERMKVLCVNNGEWLPEEREIGNMMNMVEDFVRRRARATADA
ncbi:hypothetical protein PLICRDRAFT_128007 [Plicaturopsis crispa FD-325 SS-3]|nr:hypothetical protein PLICRDRAFT_128007 [Plicaturopsis crispa FD-325 SS-3]